MFFQNNVLYSNYENIAKYRRIYMNYMQHESILPTLTHVQT